MKHTEERSTSTAAQHHRLIRLLTEKPRNTFDLRRSGIVQVSTRVFELRRRGFTIITCRGVATDDDGFTHANVATYSIALAKAKEEA